MHIVVRSRGWLLMVLVLTVVAAAWATAGAAAPTGSPTVVSVFDGGQKPGACPALGEPDTGTTPAPKKNGISIPDPRGGDGQRNGHTYLSWFDWFIRILKTTYFGVR